MEKNVRYDNAATNLLFNASMHQTISRVSPFSPLFLSLLASIKSYLLKRKFLPAIRQQGHANSSDSFSLIPRFMHCAAVVNFSCVVRCMSGTIHGHVPAYVHRSIDARTFSEISGNSAPPRTTPSILANTRKKEKRKK